MLQQPATATCYSVGNIGYITFPSLEFGFLSSILINPLPFGKPKLHQHLLAQLLRLMAGADMTEAVS